MRVGNPSGIPGAAILRKAARAMARWSDADVPDQTGRVAAVTGATGGLGLRVAEVLAAHGARVLLGSRNPERGAAALARVAAVATAAAPEIVDLDLSSLSSVRAAATDIRDRAGGRLDLLVNNGGIMAPPLTFSADGYELQWATNSLGAAALTWQLLPRDRGDPRQPRRVREQHASLQRRLRRGPPARGRARRGLPGL
ncbi:MAG: SDR family NAD(P)-dependent oxidoreductase [Galbitalea sp.]